ncbi:Gfo/Idh/MocA family protein [Dermatobacter hominis]|uniref:Gfo/Idh/MocA family protein n=1 Tax=Dermatobacter hominis TaxID=2884263 RepID=UPI001D117611|nr:Gfo/Idh/MocA family oxidoreductase [Dermatobacter hominis]UDY35866.1 Gfo/Idh/MocA family oxidoreductase [Dermatobacter hominis]
MPTPLPIRDRPVRLGVVGLGQIAELAVPPYLGRPDVDVVALCDRDPGRRDHWARRVSGARPCASLDEVVEQRPDVVDVLVPTPVHHEVVCRLLDAGVHVQVQKPLARDLAGADAMLAAAARSGATLRVLEDYLYFPPLVRMKQLIDQGEIGTPVNLSMKIVGNGRGGWDLTQESLEWQFDQIRDGRGMLVFDHGWHQLAVATWLFGPIERVFGWLGTTEVAPGYEMDAPSTLVWEHRTGVRGVLDIGFAVDMYLRSSHYTGDERVEVTGSCGYVRTNRISAQGIAEPALVLYRDGETRSFHDLDDRPPDAFRASADAGIGFLTGRLDRVDLTGEDARHVLVALLTALESNEAGRPLPVPSS